MQKHTLRNLDKLMASVVDRVQQETGSQMMISYGIANGKQLDYSVINSKNMDFATGCVIQTLTTEKMCELLSN